MSYLYVISAENLTKIGFTISPKVRIDEHRRQVRCAIQCHYLFKCDDNKERSVESEALGILKSAPRFGREWMMIDPEQAREAILDAASNLSVDLKTSNDWDKNNEKSIKPLSIKFEESVSKRVRDQAKRERRKVSNLIQMVMEDYVDEQEREIKSAARTKRKPAKTGK